MKVEVVDATSLTPVYAAIQVVRQCENPEFVLPKIVESGHWKILEHAHITFRIEGITRACAGQLKAHNSPINQESQRYINPTNDKNLFVVGPDVEPEIGEFLKHAKKIYCELRLGGMSEEMARWVLPQGMMTRVVMSFRARDLWWFLKLRICYLAREEMQLLARLLLQETRGTWYDLFHLWVPRCDKCPEPCGRTVTNW